MRTHKRQLSLFVFLFFLGFGWIPIIKTIWSPSFATANLAFSFGMLIIVYLVCDTGGGGRWHNWRWSGAPFSWVGMNSLGVSMASRLCIPWIPWTTPAFFGLPDTPVAIYLAASATLLTYLLGCAWFHYKGLYWSV